MNHILPVINHHLKAYEQPRRRALSSRFPVLVKPIVFTKKTVRQVKNNFSLSKLKSGPFLSSVLARHSSLLYRKLGDSDNQLQINKVTNLKIAINKLNGLVIPPGVTFSLWHALGNTSSSKGYVEGMLLSNGQVSKGIGGGLCQLSNFLLWIFLHTDVEVVERYHHSVDAFPDFGRTLPFGSGATILCNYIDLQIKNISTQPLQIKLWLTDTCLKGQILSDRPAEVKFHLAEKNHYFIKKGMKYFRFNEIYRTVYKMGVIIKEEKLFTNFAPVVYPVDEQYIKDRNYNLITLSK